MGAPFATILHSHGLQGNEEAGVRPVCGFAAAEFMRECDGRGGRPHRVQPSGQETREDYAMQAIREQFFLRPDRSDPKKIGKTLAKSTNFFELTANKQKTPPVQVKREFEKSTSKTNRHENDERFRSTALTKREMNKITEDGISSATVKPTISL